MEVYHRLLLDLDCNYQFDDCILVRLCEFCFGCYFYFEDDFEIETTWRGIFVEKDEKGRVKGWLLDLIHYLRSSIIISYNIIILLTSHNISSNLIFKIHFVINIIWIIMTSKKVVLLFLILAFTISSGTITNQVELSSFIYAASYEVTLGSSSITADLPVHKSEYQQ